MKTSGENMTMIKKQANLVKIIRITVILILMGGETLIPVDEPIGDHTLFIKQNPRQKRATSLIMTIRSKNFYFSYNNLFEIKVH